MSEHKKKFYQVPFNDALVGFLYILAYAMYFEFLPILYRKFVNPLAHFNVAWLFYAFILGAFGLAIIVMSLWNIADRLPLGVLSVLCRCFGVIVGIPSAILVAIPIIHMLVPYYIVELFLKITGHTAAKKAQEEKEKEKEKQYQEETERINRMAWEAQQYYEEAAQEAARQKAIQQMQDYAKSLGFSHIPSMEEFKHARNAYLKKYHPDNGGTNEGFIRAQKEMEDMEEIVKLWHAGHLYDNVESEETYDK